MFCRKIGAEGSVLQELCHFVILTANVIFLRFCSVTLVTLDRFCSNFHHTLTIRHCMFCRKIGAEGSFLQELCHFVILTANVYHSTDSAYMYFVKSTPPRAFGVSF